MMREAPPVITMTNTAFPLLPSQRPSLFMAQETFKNVNRIIDDKLHTFLSYTADTSGLDQAQTAIRKLTCHLYASMFQVELRTPPNDWPCTPSPRLFGLDRGEW